MIEKYIIWALPVLLSAFLVSIITRKHKDKERFNLACDTFCFAFSSELAALKNPALDNPIDLHVLLVAAFDKHRTAISEFKIFLSERQQRKIDKVWNNYCGYDDTSEEATEFLIKYSPGWEGKPPSECRKLAITNIERLLKFAQHK